MNPSECHEALSTLFDEWLDPSLDETRRLTVQREVERIIAACPEGEREWRGLLELGATLRQMPVVVVPTRVRSNVNAMLHTEAAPRKRFWSLNSFVWAGSASFVVLALLVVAYPLRFQPDTYQVPAVNQETENASDSTTSTPETASKAPKPVARSAKKPESSQKQTTKNSTPESNPAQGSGSSVQVGSTPKTKGNEKSDNRGNSTENSDAARESASVMQTQAAPPAAVRAVPLPAQPAEAQIAKHAESKPVPRRNAAPSRAAQTPSFAPSKPLQPLPSTESAAERSTSVSPSNGTNRQSASKLSVPSPKPASAKSSPSAMRFRTAPLDATALNDGNQRNLSKDWEEAQVTFTVVSLPASQNSIASAPVLESRAMPPASSAQQPQVLRAGPRFARPPYMQGQPLNPRQDAAKAKPAEAKSAPANLGEARVGSLQAIPAAPLSSPPQSTPQMPAVGSAGFAAPTAPSTTVPQTVAPSASSIAPAPMVAAPTNQNTGSGSRVFQVPSTTPRRFRVTVQAPRFLGPAQARLEGSKIGTRSASLWNGTLEPDTPVTFEVEAVVASGESLNLVLEQIRPNGESGEQKTFPLVRP